MSARRRTVALALVAATSATAATCLALAGPATAEYGTEITAASIPAFSMGTETSKTFTVTAAVTGADQVDFVLHGAAANCWRLWEYGDMRADGAGRYSATFTITRAERDNACAGTATLRISAADSTGAHGWDDRDFPVLFQRQSRFASYNFSPEPVRKGGTVTGVGAVQRASWDDNAYHAIDRPPLAMQFRTLTGSYATVKTVTADSAGRVSSKATQSADGCWHWLFAGYSTTTPVTSTADCVDSY